MNLTTDPWIPIVWTNGTAGLSSLTDVFQRGRDISDLAVRPHGRVALMRLLLCVSHASLNGPADHEDWQNCLDRLPSAAAKYLAKGRPSFELYGEEPRFQQWKAKSEPKIISVHKLMFVDEQSATLFNHDATPDTALQARILVVALATFQSFAAGGRIDGINDPHLAAICRKALHCFIRHDSLLATIHANLLTKEQIQGLAPLNWGKPSWEFQALSAEDLMPYRQKINCGYLSRLVPREIAGKSCAAKPLFSSGLRPSATFRSCSAASTAMTAPQTQNPGASPSGVWRSAGRLAMPTNWHARDTPADRCRHNYPGHQ